MRDIMFIAFYACCRYSYSYTRELTLAKKEFWLMVLTNKFSQVHLLLFRKNLFHGFVDFCGHFLVSVVYVCCLSMLV